MYGVHLDKVHPPALESGQVPLEAGDEDGDSLKAEHKTGDKTGDQDHSLRP